VIEMQDRLVQAIRYKLQKRVRRLNSADNQQFHLLLRIFFQFFDSSPLLAGVRDEMLARVAHEDVPGTLTRIIGGEGLIVTTEGESAALGYLMLKKFAEGNDEVELSKIVWAIRPGIGKADEMLDVFRSLYLEPFYEYIDEHIDDQQAILYFLRRYKHRSEWFHAERLRKAVEDDTQRGEKSLAYDLYEYLHDQGIDLHIEPQSASGIADLVAEQVGNDRVIADTKVFWPEKSKGKTYILSGFHQAYTYACDFNEPCAYLVIYKMCKESLNFLVPPSEATFPCLSLNNKTIFFIVVDICDHGASASKRGPLKSVDVTEKELIQSAEADQGELPTS
jgi:hypothetical protein